MISYGTNQSCSEALFKCQEKIKIGSKYKRKYGEAKTPYQRVLECPDVSQEKKDELTALYLTLDPIKLRKQIDRKIKLIISTVRSGF